MTKKKAQLKHYCSSDIVLKLSTGLLLLCFAIQAKDHVAKYILHQITVAKNTEVHESLQFPAISFCPGYKREVVVKNYKWFLSAWENDPASYEDTEDVVIVNGQEIWNYITYDLKDFLVYFRFYVGEDLIFLSPELLLQRKSDHFWVEQHETYNGKCFTLHVSEAVPQMKFLTLVFDFNKIDSKNLVLTFHHPRGSLALNSNYWAGPVTSAELKATTSTTFYLSKDMSKKSVGPTEDEFYDCIDSKVVAFLNGNMISNCREYCYFPSFGSIFGVFKNKTFPPCVQVKDLQCTQYDVNEMLYSTIDPDEACPQPASQANYRVTTIIDNGALLTEGRSVAYVGYETTDVVVEEEYVLMDFFELISTLGGTLGLFVGWSFLNAVELVLKAAKRMGIIH